MTQNSWDEAATGWDTRADTRLYAERAFESWNRKIAPLVSYLTESRVLDFGCGTGLLTEKLAPLYGEACTTLWTYRGGRHLCGNDRCAAKEDSR